jgi:F-type H+-transporting ATPase subunit b
MSITVTLIVQGLAFLAVAWLVMRFGWPSIIGAIEERQKKIADGLAAADKGQKDLAEATSRSIEALEAAKQAAQGEGARIVASAREDAATETNRARDQLRKEFGTMVVVGASRLLEREVDAKTHAQLLDKLADEIARG